MGGNFHELFLSGCTLWRAIMAYKNLVNVTSLVTISSGGKFSIFLQTRVSIISRWQNVVTAAAISPGFASSRAAILAGTYARVLWKSSSRPWSYLCTRSGNFYDGSDTRGKLTTYFWIRSLMHFVIAISVGEIFLDFVSWVIISFMEGDSTEFESKLEDIRIVPLWIKT